MTQETTQHTTPTVWRETLYLAAINCSHSITHDSIVLHRDPAKDGSALSQMADRLAAEALPGGAVEQSSGDLPPLPAGTPHQLSAHPRFTSAQMRDYACAAIAARLARQSQAAPVAKAVPEGLSFDGYSDSDEHYGKTILDLVRSRLEVDPDDMEAGDVFYVSACWTQPQEWRVVFRNGGTVEVERTAPPVAAPTAQEVTQQAAKAEPAEQAKPVARLHEETSDRPFTEGKKYFEITILDRARCYDGMELFAPTTSTVSAPEKVRNQALEEADEAIRAVLWQVENGNGLRDEVYGVERCRDAIRTLRTLPAAQAAISKD